MSQGTQDLQFLSTSAYEPNKSIIVQSVDSPISKCCAGAKTALVTDFLKPLRHLPAAGDFFKFLMHKDGRQIPVSLEAFDEVQVF